MASGAGSNFEALVQACAEGRLQAEVALLVVNNPGCGAQQRAGRLAVPCQVHDHRSVASREALDQALVAAFQAASVDVVVMAGWMRDVTPTLIGAFAERLINIHPSLLPSFRGLDIMSIGSNCPLRFLIFLLQILVRHCSLNHHVIPLYLL